MNPKLSLLAAALLAAHAAVWSQDDPQQLERLVVTASRAPIEARHATQSITIITREDIEQRQSIHVTDLLRDVPGLALTRAGAVGSQVQVRVRGSESNHVLVMIDGVEVNDPAGSDDFRFEHLTTADIERIEIVRGPQSALWGTDALAGVINIITRSGSGGGAVFAETGSNGTINAGANGGFASERLQGHFGVTHFDTDGSNISRVGDEADGAETTTATARLQAQLGRNADLDAMLRHVSAGSDIDSIDFAQTGLPTDAPLRNDLTRNYLKLHGATRHMNERLTQSMTLNYLDTVNKNLDAGATTDTSESGKLMLRYQLDFGIADGQRLTTALDYESIDYIQRGTATAFGNPNQEQQSDVLGLVVEYVGSSEKLDWTTSIRRDDHSEFQDVTNYQAALAWSPFDHSRFRAAVGTGRKAPTFTERFGYFADVFVGNPGLEPEQSRSVELGYSFRHDRGELGITLFDQNLKDEINGFVYDPERFVFTARNEDGESHRSGLELSGDLSVLDQWQLSGSYTYMDAREPGGAGEVDEIRRPRHMAHLNVNWNHPEGIANANLNLSYNGRRDDLFFPPFPRSPETVELDAYLLLDLAVRWRVSEQLDVFARLNNLTAEDYEDVHGFATPGRTLMAGFRYHLARR